MATLQKIIRPAIVLLVEDNPADADLAREVLETSRLHLDLEVVTNGVDAISFLKRQGRFADARTPDLVLLDLNIPKMNGKEVLAEMRRVDELKSIPVVVLTSSDAEKDVAQSYELGANCYVTKPVDLAQFQEIVRSIEGFWFTIVKLPGGSQVRSEGANPGT